MGAGNTDYVVFANYLDALARTNPKAVDKIIQAKIENNQQQYNTALFTMRRGLATALQSMKAKDAKIATVIPTLISQLNAPIANGTLADYNSTVKVMNQIFKLVQNGQLEGSQEFTQPLTKVEKTG
jgi:hypothetical protein